MESSDNIKWQMNCCLCCGAPTDPSRQALSKDGLCCRAMLFIHGEAIRNKSEFNSGEEPHVIGPRQALHLFHRSSFLPVLGSFVGGPAEEVWGGMDTPGYDARNFAGGLGRTYASILSDSRQSPIATNQYKAEIGNMMYFSTTNSGDFRAVQWKAPAKLEGFSVLSELIRECVERVGKVRETPNKDYTVPGCKACNDVMTQAGTMAQFLVRNSISSEPLVPLESILSVKLNGSAGALTYVPRSATNDSKYRWDPSESTRNSKAQSWTSRACFAYYAHRCLPEKPANVSEMDKGIRTINIAFSLILLEIASLCYERYNGKRGGKKQNAKPSYVYKGIIEVYLSYIFWILLRNDNAEGFGSGRNKACCKLTFSQFHRYMFLDFIKALVVVEEDLAGALEISDVLFGNNQLNVDLGDPSILVAGGSMTTPDKVIAYLCGVINACYSMRVKPIFSRHIAGEQPDKSLLDPATQNFKRYICQVLVYNMLIETKYIDQIMHLMEKTTIDDIDTFIDSVGVHAVLCRMQQQFHIAPARIEKLLADFTDTVTLMEYSNIRQSMRPDEFQPVISAEAAEAIYLMCNALELPSEPNSQEELELLRIAPTCSSFKSVPRLFLMGAFRAFLEDKGKKIEE